MQISLLQLSVRYALDFIRAGQCTITQKPISCQPVGVDNGLLAFRLGHDRTAWSNRRTQFAFYPVELPYQRLKTKNQPCISDHAGWPPTLFPWD